MNRRCAATTNGREWRHLPLRPKGISMFQKATKLAKRVVGCTALALTVCTVLSPIDAAQARTPFVVTGQRNHSFAAVRNFYTPYQPSVRAATGRYGFYAPWAAALRHAHARDAVPACIVRRTWAGLLGTIEGATPRSRNAPHLPLAYASAPSPALLCGRRKCAIFSRLAGEGRCHRFGRSVFGSKGQRSSIGHRQHLGLRARQM